MNKVLRLAAHTALYAVVFVVTATTIGLAWSQWGTSRSGDPPRKFATLAPVGGRTTGDRVMRIRSGREWQLILIGASTCGASTYPGLSGAVRAVHRGIADSATAAGVTFTAAGIALDWDVEAGLRFLNDYGPFDEISTGRNWMNGTAERYLFGDLAAAPSLPQLVLVERTVEMLPGRIKRSDPVVLERKIGYEQIFAWAGMVPPSPAADSAAYRGETLDDVAAGTR